MKKRKGKRLWALRIDKEFRNLIRPLFKTEFLQLEENLLAEGCRDPICIWGDIIIDGYNRYAICTKHEIPFAVAEMNFTCREEAISWICSNQLGRRNLTEESRKYLIGKQYEAEKIITRRRQSSHDTPESTPDTSSSLPYETYIPQRDNEKTSKIRTADKIADENHISHGTVEKYAIYSKAIDEINKKEPLVANKILSSRYKISHNGVITLSKKSPEEIHDLNNRLTNTEYPFARYQTTRQLIQSSGPKADQQKETGPSIKDIPKYDPDAEVTGLTLTIPSWIGSIHRINKRDLNSITPSARDKLEQALTDLQTAIITMLTFIREDRQ